MGLAGFPILDIVVEPVKGRAAVWYSALPTTLEVDERVVHEAQPVLKGISSFLIMGSMVLTLLRGVKWACNKWVHIGNFYDNWASLNGNATHKSRKASASMPL